MHSSSTRPSARISSTGPRGTRADCATAALEAAAGAARRPAHPRRDDRSAGLRPQRAPDILAANQLGYALHSTYLTPGQPTNTARFAVLDPRAKDFYLDWDRVTDEVVAILRSEAGRDPYDRNRSDLVGELSTQSQAFRTKWAAHNVRFHDTGIKRLHHPVVGDRDLTYEAMELSADAGLTMFAYTAEPGSKSEEAMHLLASWAATPDAAGTAHAADRA